MSQADTRYDPTKPWGSDPEGTPEGAPLWSYLGPFTSNAERLVQDTLQLAFVPGEELLEKVRPPLDQIVMFPPRYGYRQQEIGIFDVLNIDQVPWDSGQQRTDWSGTGGEINSGSRNAQSDTIGTV